MVSDSLGLNGHQGISCIHTGSITANVPGTISHNARCILIE